MNVNNVKTAPIPAVSTAPEPVSVILPSKGWADLKLGELWAYRELIFFLTWRDIKVRYKQTVLGAAWAVIQPFTTMVLFTVIFGGLAAIPSDGIPYPVFSFAALVPWTFFANGFQKAAESMVGSANMIKKIYFPRFAVPISCVMAGVLDFVLAFIMLVGIMVYYTFAPGMTADFTPTYHLLYLPLFTVLLVVTTLGASLWFAAMNVQFRDVRYIVPFLVQTFLYLTPVIYPSSILSGIIPKGWEVLNGLNPMAGVIEGFRWALLHRARGQFPEEGVAPPLSDMQILQMASLSSVVAIVILVTGAFYFKRMERTFADVV
jgi:lipopolysaccharide transport system permease protein